MISSQGNRFEEFFAERSYTTLKNRLYDYLLRKRAVHKALRGSRGALILEVGSGISPVAAGRDGVVYTDLSWPALRNLRNTYGKGWYVVADAMHLPFRTGCFSHAVSSEVLEHIPDDRGAIKEIARVIEPSGTAIITFPHRRFYFARDDRFVHHLRRYELGEMVEKLEEAGLHPLNVRKVLGPLEKATMCLAVTCFTRLKKSRKAATDGVPSAYWISVFSVLNRLYAVLVWFDALIMPRALSSVLLIQAAKGKKAL
jgi:SAM-dependent methyltransferase